MKLPPFDTTKQEWDRHRRFHISPKPYGYPVTQFQSGELTIDTAKPNPIHRGINEKYNIALELTSDCKGWEFRTPAGEPIPKAQLALGGGQYLLIDMDRQRAVKLGYGAPDETPMYLRSAAYFKKAGGIPVGHPVLVHKVTPEVKQWLDEVCATVEALVTLRELVRPHLYYSNKYDLTRVRELRPDPVQAAEHILARQTLLAYTLKRQVIAYEEIAHDYLIAVKKDYDY